MRNVLRKIILAFTLLTFILNLVNQCTSMLGGTPTSPKEYKYMAAVYCKTMKENKSLTSAVVIGKKWILTSCSRLSLYKISDYIVVAGDFSYPTLRDDVQVRRLLFYYCHNESDGYRNAFDHDLAVAGVDHPFVQDDWVEWTDVGGGGGGNKTFFREASNTSDPDPESSQSEAPMSCKFVGAGSPTKEYQSLFYFVVTDVKVFQNLTQCGEDKDKEYQMCSRIQVHNGSTGAMCRGDDSGALICGGSVTGLAVRKFKISKKDGKNGCDVIQPRNPAVLYHKLSYYNVMDGDVPSDSFKEAICKLKE